MGAVPPHPVDQRLVIHIIFQRRCAVIAAVGKAVLHDLRAVGGGGVGIAPVPGRTMVAPQRTALLGSLHHFFKVLGAADAVFFANFKQRALARQIVRNGGLLFLGGEVAGFFTRGQPAGAFGLIDAQPLAHGGVADADALRGGLTADLAG